jgi:hypothetical protein
MVLSPDHNPQKRIDSRYHRNPKAERYQTAQPGEVRYGIHSWFHKIQICCSIRSMGTLLCQGVRIARIQPVGKLGSVLI